MSLAIDVDSVTEVLLRDGWHKVIDDSFDTDAYEFLHEGRLLVGGGSVAGISATGATWKERDDTWVACPLPAILAVSYTRAGRGVTNAQRPQHK